MLDLGDGLHGGGGDTLRSLAIGGAGHHAEIGRPKVPMILLFGAANNITGTSWVQRLVSIGLHLVGDGARG